MTWALENGVVSEGEAPDAVLTREEMVVMLYRLAELWKLDTGSNVTLSRYSDSADVSVDAFNALRWAVGKGYVNGMDGALEPKSKASRAQAAALLDRFAADDRQAN